MIFFSLFFYFVLCYLAGFFYVSLWTFSQRLFDPMINDDVVLLIIKAIITLAKRVNVLNGRLFRQIDM